MSAPSAPSGPAHLAVSVESWSPGWGSSLQGGDELVPTHGEVDVGCEVPAGRWEPRGAAGTPAERVVFVDGVRRVDAQLWVTDERGTRPGLAVSLAAGLVTCDGRAVVGPTRTRRGIVGQAPMPRLDVRGAVYDRMHVGGGDPETLLAGAQDRLGTLERTVAADAPDGDLLVVDGPLPGDHGLAHAVGYVKSHHMAYLPDEQAAVIGRLPPGRRSPLFVIQTSRSRYSWYLRLPGGRGHPWAGVVRCEASADLGVGEAAALADRVTASLPRFASQPHKDPRAPQNLYPIAGLERRLKRLLGDARLLERGLRSAVRAR